MTSRERFEAWAATQGGNISQFEYETWQACEAQSAARIAQLEGENVRIRNAARAAINILREALTNYQGE